MTAVNRPSRVILFLALTFTALTFAAESEAAGIQQGQYVYFTTKASSAGAPCEYSCWEMWQSALGSIMVVKDASGAIVESGRLSEAYFLDLYKSVDEANRKIPSAAQTSRLGIVRTVVGAPTCFSNCTVGIDYGYAKQLMLGIGSTGKIAGSRETDDAIFDAHPMGPFNPPSGRECSATGDRSCSQYVNTRPGAGGGPIGGIIITIWAEFDSLGNFIGWTYQYSDGRPDQFVSFNP